MRARAVMAAALALCVLALTARGEDAAPNPLADGWRALRAGNLVTAERAFGRAATESPDDAGPHEGLAKVAERRKDAPRAVSHYEAALARSPHTARWHVAAGKLLSDMRQHPRAVAHLREATQLDPEDAATWSTYAQALWRVEWLPQAAEAYERAIALLPNDPWAHTGLGDTRLRMGVLDDAITAYETALELDPRAYAAHCGKGAALSKQGAFEPALASLREAVRLRPDYAPAFYEIGVAHQHNKEYEAALGAFGKAVQLDGWDVSAVKNMARCYARMGRRDLAKKANDHAAKLQHTHSALAEARAYVGAYPDKPGAYLRLGAIYSGIGQADAAIAAYTQALDRDAASIQAATGLADAYLTAGRLPEAAEAHRALISLRPLDIETRVMFGMLLRELGEDGESRHVLSESHAMANTAARERGRGDDWNVLAYALLALQRHTEAEDAMQRAMRLNPAEPSYAGRLASIRAAKESARRVPSKPGAPR
jgi:tetratricopeptide (TPR) repeat protein